MKYLILVILFASIRNSCYSQTFPQVEVRLRLLDTNVNGKKALALGVSFINHTYTAVYIPNLSYFAIWGTHFYRKINKKWIEIDYHTHEPITSNKIAKVAHGDQVYVKPLEIFFTNKYRNSEKALHSSQDSILKAYCISVHQDYMKYIGMGFEPIFLKANRTIDNYIVRNLDSLLTTQDEFKIAFNSEKEDEKTLRLRDSFVLNSAKISSEYPEYMLQFKRALPQKFISNVLYYPAKKGSAK